MDKVSESNQSLEGSLNLGRILPDVSCKFFRALR